MIFELYIGDGLFEGMFYCCFECGKYFYWVVEWEICLLEILFFFNLNFFEEVVGYIWVCFYVGINLIEDFGFFRGEGDVEDVGYGGIVENNGVVYEIREGVD